MQEELAPTVFEAGINTHQPLEFRNMHASFSTDGRKLSNVDSAEAVSQAGACQSHCSSNHAHASSRTSLGTRHVERRL
eukprot:3062637-Amphidinium_carterae.1